MAFSSQTQTYISKIHELEDQKNALQAKLKSYDERVQTELTKIRDAWRARLEALKLENAQLKQEVFQYQEELALTQQESTLLNRYKKELYEKESLIESQRERLRHTEQLEKQIKLQGLQQKRIDDLQHELQNMARHKGVLEAKNKELNRSLHEWQKVASAYLDDTSACGTIEPEMFQNRLLEDHANATRLELEHSTLSMQIVEAQKNQKDSTLKIKSLEREVKHSALEIEELQKALEIARLNEAKLSSQIGVLKRCMAKQISSGDSSLENTDPKATKSPQTEPAVLGTDLEKDPLVINLRSQLNERKNEIELLRKDLSQAESRLGKVADLESQVESLRNQLAKTTNIKNQLITKMQKLQIANATSGARCTSSNSTDTETRSGDYFVDCLQKAKDTAVKRAEMAKRDAKVQRELTTLLIQKVLGWTFNLVEDKDKVIVQLQSTYSPSTDGGWIQISTKRDDLLQMLDNRRRSSTTSSPALHGAKIGGRSVLSPNAECTTPIISQTTASEPEMEMAFVGRYRDKWRSDPRWRCQLSNRKAFATFLAFVCLDEHHSRQRRKGWTQPLPGSPAATLLNAT